MEDLDNLLDELNSDKGAEPVSPPGVVNAPPAPASSSSANANEVKQSKSTQSTDEQAGAGNRVERGSATGSAPSASSSATPYR